MEIIFGTSALTTKEKIARLFSETFGIARSLVRHLSSVREHAQGADRAMRGEIFPLGKIIGL